MTTKGMSRYFSGKDMDMRERVECANVQMCECANEGMRLRLRKRLVAVDVADFQPAPRANFPLDLSRNDFCLKLKKWNTKLTRPICTVFYKRPRRAPSCRSGRGGRGGGRRTTVRCGCEARRSGCGVCSGWLQETIRSKGGTCRCCRR